MLSALSGDTLRATYTAGPYSRHCFCHYNDWSERFYIQILRGALQSGEKTPYLFYLTKVLMGQNVCHVHAIAIKISTAYTRVTVGQRIEGSVFL